MTEESNGSDELYLIINNISKRANVRTLFTSATAFGAKVAMGKCMWQLGKYVIRQVNREEVNGWISFYFVVFTFTFHFQ